ncbi:MAG TPA: TetR/AcrR family transcriptional regulator [Gammaproteobacteria bacterium]|nr:TetR/AcrR family transcriptional regulator [Gammaproteobacteria bacterium]
MSVTRLPRRGRERSTDSQHLSRARTPAQARSRERVELILDAAAALVERMPIEQITMARIAARAGVSRSSIYQFFPSVFAIYNDLGRRFLDELLQALREDRGAREAPTWREVNACLIRRAVEFYNDRPVARALLLGSGSAQELRVIDKDYDRRFAEAAREILGEKWRVSPIAGHDPLQVAVVLNTSVFSIGVFEEGCISDFYREQAYRASTGYLESFVREA